MLIKRTHSCKNNIFSISSNFLKNDLIVSFIIFMAYAGTLNMEKWPYAPHNATPKICDMC